MKGVVVRAAAILATFVALQACTTLTRPAQQDGADFNLAYIGPDFSSPRAQEFDNAYMKRLYDYAYAVGASGKAWHKAPLSETARERH